LWGRRWKEIQLAFFTVYLDDSGTAPDQPIASASALIIPGKQILNLEAHWDRFIKAQGLSDFHASACAAAPSTKEKQYHHLDDCDKKHIFARVRQFCKKYGVQTFGFSVHKPDFDSVINGDFRLYAGGHYTWAVRHVIREIEIWRRDRKIIEPLQYIFDWQDPGSDSRDEIDDLMGQACEWQKEPFYHDFKMRKHIPGLQCVDLIAWLTLQLGLNNFHAKSFHGLALECIEDFENYYPYGMVPVNKKWFQVPTIQRSALEKWFADEIGKGQSVPWFRDWYARHPNREVLLHAREKKRV
jgi:hypothetical protein